MRTDKPPTYPLTRVKYVMDMGWYRWGRKARLKWLDNLEEACNATIRLCQQERQRLYPERHDE